MTFIGPLVMYNNFPVTVYGTLDNVHIFSDSLPPANLDLLLSAVIIRVLAWVPISYVFSNSKSLRPTYFRALI
jgi:hypothetical protein